MTWHPFRHVGLKLVALALGTLLWFTVTGQPSDETGPAPAVVTLEDTARLEVPVSPTIGGRPADGFVVDEIRVEPASVVVVGPEGRLSDEVSAITDRVSIEGRTSTLEQETTVRVFDPDGRLLGSRTVTVIVSIAPDDAAP